MSFKDTSHEMISNYNMMSPPGEHLSLFPFSKDQKYLERDGLLQDVEQELQLQQGHGVGRVGGQRQEAVLLAPGQQVLLEQPGEVLQAGSRQGQRAAAVQDQVTWSEEETIQ